MSMSVFLSSLEYPQATSSLYIYAQSSGKNYFSLKNDQQKHEFKKIS